MNETSLFFVLFFTDLRTCCRLEIVEISTNRETGIDVVGPLSWGSHFCQFYKTKKDLTDILVPYFKKGLENNEFCVWVTSDFLTTQEAEIAMAKAVPNYSKYKRKGQIEIFPYTEWYLRGGKFEMDRVLNDWVKKHDYALSKGFEGIRVSGNPFWIDNKKDWRDFEEYEAKINEVVHNYKILVCCTYSLDKCDASEIMDVIKNHEFAVVLQRGKWKRIESLNVKKLQHGLKKSEERFFSLYSAMTEGVAFHEIVYDMSGKPIDYIIKDVNPAYEKITGLKKIDVLNKKASEIYGTGTPPYLDVYSKVVANKKPFVFEIYFPPMEKYFNISVFSLAKGQFATVFRNITERKNREKALLVAKHEWERTFESVPDMIAILDTKHRIVRVNHSMAKKLKMKPDDCVGMNCFNCVHNAKKPPAFCPHSLTLKDAKEHTVEIHEDNFKGDFLVTTTPLFDDNKKVTGSVHVIRDISEQKNREKRLTKLVGILKAINKSNHALTRVNDEKEFLKEVCRIMTQDCGYAMVWIGYAEKNKEKTVTPVAYAGFEKGYLESLNITWADVPRGRGPTGTAIRTGKPAGCKNIYTDPKFKPWRESAIKRGYASSLVLPLKNGSDAFGAINIYSKIPNTFSDDEIKFLSELADDISYGISWVRLRKAKTEMENALQNSEERYRNLVNSSPDAILVHNFKKIFFINPSGIKLAGAERWKVLQSLPLKKIIPVKYHKKLVETVKKLEKKQSALMEIAFLRPNGERVEVEATSTPIIYQGKPAVQSIVRNITSRKRLESEREHLIGQLTDAKNRLEIHTAELEKMTEELQKTNKSKTEFISLTAHQLRTPLATISLTAELLLRNIAGKMNEEGREYLESIYKDVGYMTKLIRIFLDVSKSEMGVFEIRPEKCDIAAILNKNLEEFEQKIKTKELTLIKKIETKLPEIKVDKYIMHIIFENLISNAVKYTPRKGKIKVRIQKNRNNMVFSISDDGCGVPKNEQSRIFEKLYRASNARNANMKGVGLGLYLSQKLIKASGGDIHLKSKINKGSTFYVSIPITGMLEKRVSTAEA